MSTRLPRVTLRRGVAGPEADAVVGRDDDERAVVDAASRAAGAG